MRRFCFSAEILAAALVISGLVLASPSSAAESGSAASALPTWLHRTVEANTYVAPASSFVPSIEAVGTAAARHDVTASVSDTSNVKFGLVTFPSTTQTYPVISTDGGTTWNVDGPLFHVDALQGASVVASSGALRPHGAYLRGAGATSSGPPTTRVLTGGRLHLAPESII